jgi:hypothetical protein
MAIFWRLTIQTSKRIHENYEQRGAGDGAAIQEGCPVPKDNPEEIILKVVGLTLSARGRVAILMAAPVAVVLLAVAWRILVG